MLGLSGVGPATVCSLSLLAENHISSPALASRSYEAPRPPRAKSQIPRSPAASPIVAAGPTIRTPRRQGRHAVSGGPGGLRSQHPGPDRRGPQGPAGRERKVRRPAPSVTNGRGMTSKPEPPRSSLPLLRQLTASKRLRLTWRGASRGQPGTPRFGCFATRTSCQREAPRQHITTTRSCTVFIDERKERLHATSGFFGATLCRLSGRGTGARLGRHAVRQARHGDFFPAVRFVFHAGQAGGEPLHADRRRISRMLLADVPVGRVAAWLVDGRKTRQSRGNHGFGRDGAGQCGLRIAPIRDRPGDGETICG